jgi:hypothetical protein
VQSGKGNSQGLTDLERHFDRYLARQFFKELLLEASGKVRVGSRDCIRLHAVLRSGGHLWPHWLAASADEYEFHADCERGALLAVISKYQGRVLSSSEVIDVHFDEALPDDLFVYTPHVGEQIRSPEPAIEHLTLASAIEKMPFTVFIPSRTQGLEQVRVAYIYHPSTSKWPWAHLALSYFGGRDNFLMIFESATEDPTQDKYAWEHLIQNGQELRISDPGEGRGYRIVALDKQGTFLEMWSNREREVVLELATSLVPAVPSGLK